MLPSQDLEFGSDFAWSSVTYPAIPARCVAESSAKNDLSSAVEENMQQMGKALELKNNDLGFTGDAGQGAEELDIIKYDRLEDVDITLGTPEYLVNVNSFPNIFDWAQAESLTETNPSETTSTTHSEYTTMSTSCLSAEINLRDRDSGYGSISGELEEPSRLNIGPQVSADSNYTLKADASGPASTVNITKRQLPSKHSHPTLVCPFYKCDRRRCKHDSCATGFPYIYRLKEHLKRTHLYHQCTRCGLAFRGKKGATALKHHSQPPKCRMLPCLPIVWGFNQTVYQRLRCRKDVLGKSDEQQWRDIYALVIPDAALSANLADEIASLAPDDDGTTTSDYIDNTQQLAEPDFQRQITENCTREILSLLLSRLTEEVHRSTSDGLVRRSWNQFKTHRLREILQEILADITPPPRKIPNPISTIMHDAVQERQMSHEATAGSTVPENHFGSEFFDFETLCD